MLKKCRGVPLAITSVASLLATHGKDVEKWEKIRDSIGCELEKNPTLEWMRHVLTLSYNDLPHHLKTCLLYIGTYPEDHEIEKVDLVRQWIGEGFVPEKHGLDLEEVAEGYFNELINRNMIQPADISWLGGVLSCRVHDLMLDLILLKCTEENFINTNNGIHNMKGTSQVRRISNQIPTGNMDLAVERMNLSQVRSYYMFHLDLKCAPVLSKFELLRVLHLELGSFGEPNSICLDISGINHLFLLRYLKATGCHLKLPKKFGKLQHLMTLDMETIWFDSSNPWLDVTSLSSLRHLILPRRPSCLELRNGVRKLCNLQTLSNFDISMNSVETIIDLSVLTNLREVYLRASRGTGEEDLDTRALKHNTLAASLRRLGNCNLRRLYTDISAPKQFWSNCFTHPHHLQLLNCWDAIRAPEVPKWMAQADRLAFIPRLQVEQLLQSDAVQVLAQMPCLTYLFLEAKMVPEKSIVINSNAFPVLEEFIFHYKLCCLTFEPDAMPKLKRLEIYFDSRAPGPEHDEVSPVGGIEHLASLEKVFVFVRTKCGEGSRLESLCRDSIQRHQRYQSIKIHVGHNEEDD